VVDAASVAADDQADEEQWEAVVDLARNRRKTLGRLKREKAQQEAAARGVWRSERLAAKAPAHHVPAATKASKLRELKDSLVGCSTVLQSHVATRGILHAFKNPLGMKSVSDLGVAALGKDAPVSDGAYV
jgi:hypothetical protein